MLTLIALSNDEAIPPEILSHTEVAFNSQCCLNSSFLHPNHSHCSSKNPGIEISDVIQSWDEFKNCKNSTIFDIVSI